MGWVINATLRPLYAWERAGTHFIGPRAGLDGYGKSRPPPGLDPRTVQPIASRYTDWVIAALTNINILNKFENILFCSHIIAHFPSKSQYDYPLLKNYKQVSYSFYKQMIEISFSYYC